MIPYKIMLDLLLLLGIWRSSTYRHLAEYLPGISIDNRCSQMLGNLDTCLCLSHTSGAEHYDKGFLQTFLFSEVSVRGLFDYPPFGCFNEIYDILNFLA